jgi:hypothetical protein
MVLEQRVALGVRTRSRKKILPCALKALLRS